MKHAVLHVPNHNRCR